MKEQINMTQGIYEEALALREAGQHQRAYELLLTIPDDPQARPVIVELLASGLIEPSKPDIPTAAFIAPQRRQVLQGTDAPAPPNRVKRFAIWVTLLIIVSIVALVAISSLGN